ncbi:MAG: tyrosine-protein phosphatase [Chloroflexota bacterium]|nr:tyrosine-protein phosphatase [Chloroflexota bacterium]
MSAPNLPEIDPRRGIPVEGAYNVRDLGGYETAEGRHVRWRTLFRAADIHALSPSAQATLTDAGVRTVIDLRGSKELVEAPSVFKDLTHVQYLPHNMTGDALINRWGTIPVPADSSIRLSTMYSTVLDERGEMIRTILETVSQPGTLPAVFHCTAGKDRTGVLAALLLSIAGVPRDSIVEDYALSARFLYGSSTVPPDGSGADKFPPFQEYQTMWCPPDAMRLTLDHLESKHGGIEAYVRSIGVDDATVARIRDALVE